jgi:hypothetical protein
MLSALSAPGDICTTETRMVEAPFSWFRV